MFYDLHIPWTSDLLRLQRTLALSDELGYDVIALNHTITGRLPADLTSPIPAHLPFRLAPTVRVLRRCTLVVSDPSENHRMTSLSSHYDLLAVRTSVERVLQQACQTLEIHLISLDLTMRYSFHFKPSLFRSAVARGVRFEICYAPGILSSDPMARRNLITNATQLIRATKGKGIIISSEASSAIGLRGPMDLVNLAAVWGLSSDRGREAVELEARSVVVMADMRRTSWRGVIDVIDGGSPPASRENQSQERTEASRKRRLETPMSKRQAKRARKVASNDRPVNPTTAADKSGNARAVETSLPTA